MSRHKAGTHARHHHRGPRVRTLFDRMHLPDDLRQAFSFLPGIKSKRAYFTLIEAVFRRYSPEWDLIRKAYDTAHEWHWIRLRHSGEREFMHLFRVSLIAWIFCGIRDPDRIAALWLHDLVETFPDYWTIDRIRLEFNDRVAYFVERLTKPRQTNGFSKEDVEEQFYAMLEMAPRECVENKACDVLDNLLTLWRRSPKAMRAKLHAVERHLIPLLRRHELIMLLKTIERVLACIRYRLHHKMPLDF